MPTAATLKPYKMIIHEGLCPDMNSEFNFRQAKKAISDYAKATGDTVGEVDLMIYYVECGNQFTLDYGDIDERFYDSLLSMYEKAADKVLLLPRKEQAEFRERMLNLVESSAGIGWGYPHPLHYTQSFTLPIIRNCFVVCDNPQIFDLILILPYSPNRGQDDTFSESPKNARSFNIIQGASLLLRLRYAGIGLVLFGRGTRNEMPPHVPRNLDASTTTLRPEPSKKYTYFSSAFHADGIFSQDNGQ